jgi:hypothetical protein
MGFYSSDLNHYDPMKDEVSWAPFQEARDIAWRARYVLRGRTTQDVRWLGAELDSWIDAYFDDEKTNSIEMLKSEGRYDLLESDDEGERWSIKPEASDDYDIRTSENTRAIDAAKEVFETMEILRHSDVQDAKEYEYFAAMALAMIGSYLHSLEYVFDISQMKSVKRPTKAYQPHEVSRFASLLIDAMEAVTYAEGVKKFSQLTVITEATLNRAEELKAAAVAKELEEIKKTDSEQRSQWGRIGKEKSLVSRDRSRAAVLEQYQQSPILHGKSIAGAATALWQWLDQEARKQNLLKYSVSTIEGWVSDRRKGKI